MTRKERSCTTLENQKEALVVQLTQKEKQLQTLKEELVSEKNEIAEKLVEARSRLEDKEDELT